MQRFEPQRINFPRSWPKLRDLGGLRCILDSGKSSIGLALGLVTRRLCIGGTICVAIPIKEKILMMYARMKLKKLDQNLIPMKKPNAIFHNHFWLKRIRSIQIALRYDGKNCWQVITFVLRLMALPGTTAKLPANQGKPSVTATTPPVRETKIFRAYSLHLGLVMSQLLSFAFKFMVSHVVLLAGIDQGEEETAFDITMKRNNDVVEVTVNKDKTVIAFGSPFGISQSVIKRTGERWPKVLVLRLHLNGLESFRVNNGTTTLSASVSNQGQLKTCLWQDELENCPLDSTSQYWMEIRNGIPDVQRQPPSPFDGSYFEMQLPKKFLESNPQSITLNWIDFYRN